MNKILIKDLLNVQNIKGQEDSMELELKKINEFLVQLSCESPVKLYEDTKEVQLKLQDVVAQLTQIRKSNVSLKTRTNINIIHQLSNLVIRMIKEFPNLKTMLESKSKGLKYCHQKESMKFNLITKQMVKNNVRESTPIRGHRFGKEKVEKLEEWYRKHYQKPYLDKKSIEMLEKSTGLSRVQLRNWLSNRRRKEKSEKVSGEVIKILRH